MGFEILIPLAPFLMVAAIVYFVTSANARERKATLEVVQTAIREGKPLTPEAIAALGVKPKREGGSALGGAILLAVAVGLIALGAAIDVLSGGIEVTIIMAGIAAIPGLIGLVLLGFGLAGKKKNDDNA